jgi:thiamine-phosphate pyrophosphorylase
MRTNAGEASDSPSAQDMLRCAITDRALLPGDEPSRRLALVALVRRWAQQGINLIQLREKDLPTAELTPLARALVGIISASGSRLLINSRADVAIAAGAHGVHLTAASDELTPAQVRTLFSRANCPAPFVSVSCHTLDDVSRARSHHADAILFGPIFGKVIHGVQHAPAPDPIISLAALHAACLAAAPIPVLALGGVTPANTPDCLAAGAAGIAAIRLFLDATR